MMVPPIEYLQNMFTNIKKLNHKTFRAQKYHRVNIKNDIL